MGSKSNQLETDILTWTYSSSAVTRPTAWYLVLFTDAAGLETDQPTSEATNVNCPGYVRQQITSWSISGNEAKNGTAVTITATGDWAAVRYFGIYDAATSGRLLHWGSIPEKTLANGDKIEFAVNAITLSED